MEFSLLVKEKLVEQRRHIGGQQEALQRLSASGNTGVCCGSNCVLF